MYLCQARPTRCEADRQVYGLYTCLYTLAGLPLPRPPALLSNRELCVSNGGNWSICRKKPAARAGGKGKEPICIAERALGERRKRNP